MKYMLMMNAPRGTGDWGVMKWPAEDLQAHIRFMKDFTKALADAGELVGGRRAGAPRTSQARARPGDGGAGRHRRSVRRGKRVPRRLLDCRRG